MLFYVNYQVKKVTNLRAYYYRPQKKSTNIHLETSEKSMNNSIKVY